MPLIKRKVEPTWLCRRSSDAFNESILEGLPAHHQDDLDFFANLTLCGALRQLSCLLQFADDIKNELESELSLLLDRTKNLTTKFVALEAEVLAHNPRTVTVRKYLNMRLRNPLVFKGQNRLWG